MILKNKYSWNKYALVFHSNEKFEAFKEVLQSSAFYSIVHSSFFQKVAGLHSKVVIILKILKKSKIRKYDREFKNLTIQNEPRKKERVRFSKVLLKRTKTLMLF